MKFNLALFLIFFSSLFCAADESQASKDSKIKLKEGDIVALCGDSITSDGKYPHFLEIYQIVCCPIPKVINKNFGRWGETAAAFPKTMDTGVLAEKPNVALICYGMNNSRSGKVMAEERAKGWGDGEILTVVKKFKEAGVRLIVLASPGVVDSEHFTLSQSSPPNPQAIEATNKNLSLLRDNAERISKEQDLVFADMHNPMIEVMAKAKEKFGKDYAFAGGKGDGVHPGQAGHLVMAWVYLKALGYSGEIGNITVDFSKDSATTSEGHTLVSYKEGKISLESIRYPFCFSGDPAKPSANDTRSVADLFSFNQDLNRFNLIIKDAPAKTEITWGGVSKEFDSATLSKGINLAAEFTDNPFCKPFETILFNIGERNRCRKWLIKEYKDDPGMQKRLDTAIAKTIPLPIKHEILIEAVK
jgi:hypothetical protein